jgi:hypothetical protein
MVPLERSIKLDVWKKAKTMASLHDLLNPGSRESTYQVYIDLLNLEAQVADKFDNERREQTLLHSQADEDT